MKVKKGIQIKNTVQVMAFCLIVFCVAFVYAASSFADEVNITDYSKRTATQEAIDYLSMMQIIENPADYADKSSITKSEAAELIVRSLNAQGIASALNYSDEFYAMFESRDEAKSFGYAIKLGVVSGDYSGNYGVYDNITYNQAVKMLVCALGYESIAQLNGGWSVGYIIQAGNLGITDGVADTGGIIPASDFLLMLRNSFEADFPQLESDGGNFVFSVKGETTLEDYYLASKGWIKGEGVVNANETFSIMNGFEVEEGEVLIDEEIFYANNTGISDYVGYSVTYVAHNPDKSRDDDIVGFFVSEDNYCVNLSRLTDCEFSNGYFKYRQADSNQDKKLHISPSAACIYNNGLDANMINSSIDFSNIDIDIIDNNNDNIFDVINITESKSYTVRKINEPGEKIFLKSGVHNGSASLNLEDDDDKTIVVRNTDGTNADWKVLKEDDGISVIESKDGAYLEIIILNKPIKGTVVSYQEGEIAVVDTNVYGIADGVNDITLGTLGNFWINEHNEIFFCEYDISDYAYVIGAVYKDSGVEKQLLVKLFDNRNGVGVFECSDNLKVNGIKTGNNASAVNSIPTEQIAAVTVNAENLITKIDSVEEYASEGDRTYCEYAHAFNDVNNETKPFRYGENTEFYIVPQNGQDSDYGMIVEYEDGDNYTTSAYGFDNSTGLVEAVVVLVDTDALRDDALSYKSDVGIVNEIKIAFDDDDQAAYFVNGFSGGKEFNYVSGHYDDVFNVMATLKKGDIIRFNTGYGNTIMRIEKLASPADLTEPFHTGRDDEEEKFFGTVMISNENVITNSSPYLYNEMYVSSEKNYSDMTLMRVWADRENTKDEDCQFGDYYIYEGDKWPVRPASVDDIVTYEMSSDDSSEVFVYRSYSEVKMVVIVK